jgi:hypothetical protein
MYLLGRVSLLDFAQRQTEKEAKHKRNEQQLQQRCTSGFSINCSLALQSFHVSATTLLFPWNCSVITITKLSNKVRGKNRLHFLRWGLSFPSGAPATLLQRNLDCPYPGLFTTLNQEGSELLYMIEQAILFQRLEILDTCLWWCRASSTLHYIIRAACNGRAKSADGEVWWKVRERQMSSRR